MKITGLITLALLLIPMTHTHTNAQQADVRALIGRADYIVDHEIPKGFFNGAFIGNGKSGCGVYKDPESPKGLRWIMGRYDVTAQRGMPKLEYCTPRVFAGDILLTPAGTVSNESLRMNLFDGEASGTFTTDLGTIAWRSYVHRDLDAFVVVMNTTAGEVKAELRVREQWGISPYFRRKKVDPETFEHQDWLPPKPTIERRGDAALITQPTVANAAHAVAWTVRSPDANTRILIAKIGAHRAPESPREVSVEMAQREALDGLARAAAMPFAEVERTHRVWWNAHMQRSLLDLPDDPAWHAYWWRQIYKFASASAEDSAWVIDTQGPWTYDADWTAVWWNLNAQLSYYPSTSANRLDVGMSLINGLKRLKDSGILNKNAGKHSADSIWFGRSSDQWGGGTWGDEYGNGTWLAHRVWSHWRYSGDDEIGRWLFDFLKQDVNYYLHTVVHEAPDGSLQLKPTRSPEFEDVTGKDGAKRGLFPNANYAVSSLHWGLQTLIELDDRFGMNDPMRPGWEEAKRRLIPPPAGENGLMIGSDQEYSGSHRHYSHLLAIYPYHLINPDQGEDARELVRKSVDYFTSKPQAFAGYSYTSAAAMYATLGDAESAIKWLDKLIPRSEPNTLYTEGGGQVVETPLSSVESVNYMLIQSWGGKVRIFPAVPARWKNVAFDRFLAEGAFEVSARREGGTTTFVKIKSKKGEPLVLKLDRPIGDMTLTLPGGVSHRIEAGLLHVQLPVGEELTLSEK